MLPNGDVEWTPIDNPLPVTSNNILATKTEVNEIKNILPTGSNPGIKIYKPEFSDYNYKDHNYSNFLIIGNNTFTIKIKSLKVHSVDTGESSLLIIEGERIYFFKKLFFIIPLVSV